MGRSRSFDEAEVLGKAMHAFRRHGYATISIKRLEEETGLTSGSIYNAYGDKDGLFRAALAYYADFFVAGRIEEHAGPTAVLEDLEELFLTLFRDPMTDGFGCLVVNSMVEFASSASAIDAHLTRSIDRVTSGIRGVLAREIGPELAVTETDRLLLLYHGILVFSRVGRFDAGFENVVRSQFDMLRRMRDGFPPDFKPQSTED